MGEGDSNEEGLIVAFFNKLYKTCQRTRENWEKDMSDLFLIASGQYNPAKSIRYPKMKDTKNGQYTNEFVEINKRKKKLSDFSPKQKR